MEALTSQPFSADVAAGDVDGRVDSLVTQPLGQRGQRGQVDLAGGDVEPHVIGLVHLEAGPAAGRVRVVAVHLEGFVPPPLGDEVAEGMDAARALPDDCHLHRMESLSTGRETGVVAGGENMVPIMIHESGSSATPHGTIPCHAGNRVICSK